jgi:hypothetical protein
VGLSLPTWEGKCTPRLGQVKRRIGRRGGPHEVACGFQLRQATLAFRSGDPRLPRSVGRGIDALRGALHMAEDALVLLIQHGKASFLASTTD